MDKRVAYITEEGSVTIVIPTDEWPFSVEELGRKDVPAGVPYKILDVADIPTDREFRDAWQIDITEPDGYGIGHEAWFAEQAAKSIGS
jgi:hypothetical protein